MQMFQIVTQRDGECSLLAAYRRAYDSADWLDPKVGGHRRCFYIHRVNSVSQKYLEFFWHFSQPVGIF